MSTMEQFGAVAAPVIDRLALAVKGEPVLASVLKHLAKHYQAISTCRVKDPERAICKQFRKVTCPPQLQEAPSVKVKDLLGGRLVMGNNQSLLAFIRDFGKVDAVLGETPHGPIIVKKVESGFDGSQDSEKRCTRQMKLTIEVPVPTESGVTKLKEAEVQVRHAGTEMAYDSTHIAYERMQDLENKIAVMLAPLDKRTANDSLPPGMSADEYRAFIADDLHMMAGEQNRISEWIEGVHRMANDAAHLEEVRFALQNQSRSQTSAKPFIPGITTVA